LDIEHLIASVLLLLALFVVVSFIKYNIFGLRKQKADPGLDRLLKSACA